MLITEAKEIDINLLPDAEICLDFLNLQVPRLGREEAVKAAQFVFFDIPKKIIILMASYVSEVAA